jgi:hypothetical protein
MLILMITAGAFLLKFPYFYLVLNPMDRSLRFSQCLKWCLVALLAATQVWFTFYMAELYPELQPAHFVIAYVAVSFIHGGLVLFLILLKQNRLQGLFSVFFTGLYYLAVNSVVLALVMNFFPYEERYTFFCSHVFLHGIVLACTWPATHRFWQSFFKDISRWPLKMWGALWIIPAAFFGWNFVNFYMDINGYYTVTAFCCVLSFLVVCHWLMIISKLETAIFEKATQNVLLRRQAHGEQKRNAFMTQVLQDVRTMQHNARAQFALIWGYLRDGNVQEAMDSCNVILNDSVSMKSASHLYCKNTILDAVLVSYLSELQKIDAVIDVRVDVPEKIEKKILTDICAITGNLLQNAFDALTHVTEGEKFVRIRVRTWKKNFMMMVENSYDGWIAVRKDVYLSRKRHGEETGIGLPFVEKLCERYDGSMIIDTTENTWKVHVELKSGISDESFTRLESDQYSRPKSRIVNMASAREKYTGLVSFANAREKNFLREEKRREEKRREEKRREEKRRERSREYNTPLQTRL